MVSFEEKNHLDATMPRKLVEVESGPKFDYTKLRGLEHGYAVGKRIGKGGMGEVWEAVRDDGQEVVIKVTLDSAMSPDDQVEGLERFIQEGLVLEEIDSAHFPKFYETNPNNKVIVMERLRGDTLYEKLIFDRVTPGEAFHIVSEVAARMFHAHEQGYIHRDLKPSNIFIGDDGQVKILDLGLVYLTHDKRTAKRRGTKRRITAPGVIIGSPRYFSPEQARGDEVRLESDVFALGCNLYEMLTGSPAFPGDDVLEVLDSIGKGNFIPLKKARPDLPTAVTVFVNYMLQTQPTHRPTMDQVSKFFKQYEGIETS